MSKWIASASLVLMTVALVSADEAKLVTKKYQVAGLITPVQACEQKPSSFAVYQPTVPPSATVTPAPQIMAASATVPAPIKFTLPPGYRENAQRLATVIMQTINPYAWEEGGGAGSIEFDERTGTLSVSQTPELHGKVVELLTALRKLQDATTPQVLVEMRIIEATGESIERLKTQFGLGEKATAFLNPEAAMGAMEFAAADRQTEILSAPRMVLVNQQTGYFEIGQTHVFQTGLDLNAGPNGVERKPRYETITVGLRASLTPRISADRKSMELKFGYEAVRLNNANPVMPVMVAGGLDMATDLIARPSVDRQCLDATMMVVSGVPVLISGPRSTGEVVTEHAVPALLKMPYVSRLYRTRSVAKEPRQQFVLLNARVMNELAKGESEVSKLVCKYKKACAEGRTEDAMKCAMKALAIDPKCFER